ncbi:MAG: hypothetical protein EOL98_01700 [Negativicutes bacterium]|nr:hypothetical protein [Negativicutes bacterium]
MRNMTKIMMALTLAVSLQVGLGSTETEASALHLEGSKQVVLLHSKHHDNGNHYGEYKHKHHKHDKDGNDLVEGVLIGIAIAEAIN